MSKGKVRRNEFILSVLKLLPRGTVFAVVNVPEGSCFLFTFLFGNDSKNAF